MAKQPEVQTLLVGYNERHKMNQNFKTLTDKFEEALSLTTGTDTPNHMETNLDVADANITNVTVLAVESITIVAANFTGLSDYYVYKLAVLGCDTQGDILTHDVLGDPLCLSIGSTGQVLKVGSTQPQWDADTDTDTIGVTVQEDGTTVANNVVNINFLWTLETPALVTTPAGNQVDIALDDVYTHSISPLWEDLTQADSNLDPESGSIFSNAAEVTRKDITSISGISTVPTTNNEYYVITEASNWFEDSSGAPPAVGYWSLAVRFYDATGTGTALTGNLISPPAGENDGNIGSTDGGNLVTVYCGVPANTKYIDFGWSLIPLFPLFLTLTTFSDRYRAVVSSGQRDLIDSPNAIAYPGGVNTQTTNP